MMTEFHDKQMAIQRFHRCLAKCEYPTFRFVVAEAKGSFFLQIECDDKCNVTGADMKWKSRKWLLSVHMTDGEIVQTAFKAVLTALEHEAREKFTYRGVTVFDPHYDIEALVELRQNPTSMKERE